MKIFKSMTFMFSPLCRSYIVCPNGSVLFIIVMSVYLRPYMACCMLSFVIITQKVGFITNAWGFVQGPLESDLLQGLGVCYWCPKG